MMDKVLIASMMVAVATAGTCSTGKSKSVDAENVVCPQYNEDTCCHENTAFLKGTVNADDGCMKVSSGLYGGPMTDSDAPLVLGKNPAADADDFSPAAVSGNYQLFVGNPCFDALNLLSCGSRCRPDYEKDFIKDGEVKLCKDFAEKIESACEELMVCPSGENCFEDKDACQVVFSKDDKGKSFDKDVLEATILAAAGGATKIKKVDGTDGCFNSADRPSMLGASLAAVAGMFATGNAGVGAALGLATLVGSAHACNPGAKAKAREGSTYCAQYNEKSCCEPQYSKGSGTVGNGCNGASALGCVDKMNLLACGASCKPDFAKDFIVVNTETQEASLKICKTFYDSMVESCKDVKACKRDDDDVFENCVADNSNCVSAFPKKKNGEDFDEDTFKAQFDFKLDIVKDDKDCFAAAPQAVVAAAAVLAAAFVRM